MSTIAIIGLIGLMLCLGAGTRFGWRQAKADQKIDRDIRDALINDEADRAQRGIYCHWRLTPVEGDL